VLEGRAGTLQAACNQNGKIDPPGGFTVVIPDPGPGGGSGPNCYVVPLSTLDAGSGAASAGA